MLERRWLFPWLAFALMLLAACGENPTEAPASPSGDPIQASLSLNREAAARGALGALMRGKVGSFDPATIGLAAWLPIPDDAPAGWRPPAQRPPRVIQKVHFGLDDDLASQLMNESCDPETAIIPCDEDPNTPDPPAPEPVPFFGTFLYGAPDFITNQADRYINFGGYSLCNVSIDAIGVGGTSYIDTAPIQYMGAFEQNSDEVAFMWRYDRAVGYAGAHFAQANSHYFENDGNIETFQTGAGMWSCCW